MFCIFLLFQLLRTVPLIPQRICERLQHDSIANHIPAAFTRLHLRQISHNPQIHAQTRQTASRANLQPPQHPHIFATHSYPCSRIPNHPRPTSLRLLPLRLCRLFRPTRWLDRPPLEPPNRGRQRRRPHGRQAPNDNLGNMPGSQWKSSDATRRTDPGKRCQSGSECVLLPIRQFTRTQDHGQILGLQLAKRGGTSHHHIQVQHLSAAESVGNAALHKLAT